LEILITTIGIVFVLGAITVLANLVDMRREPAAQVLLILAILAVNGVVALSGLLSLLAVESDDLANAAVGALILFIAAVIATLLLVPGVRNWIARFLPEPAVQGQPFLMMNTLNDGEIEFGGLYAQESRKERPKELLGFRPDSWVHTWATVIVVMALGWQVASYFLAGGLSGVAEDIGIDYLTLLASLIQNAIIPFVGVGLFLRRDIRATLKRLGLEPISWSGYGVSLALVFGLLMLVVTFSAIWEGLVSEETFKEQTEASSALAESVDTIGLAFALALTAAVGEEIAFRGALQPIFGFWVTAFVFAFSHVQYTLTPASLLIFLVALALGWVRRHFNTTTAILVHFLYNFIPLLLVVSFPEETASSVLRLLF
jgi:membrane protease YdiL (CAAX protease family)